MTPLHNAIEAACDECTEALLGAGANPRSTNPVFGESATCVHSASSRGLHNILKSILKHCPTIDVDAPDAEVRTDDSDSNSKLTILGVFDSKNMITCSK